MTENQELLPLTMAIPGEEYVLVAIDGHRGIKTRLYSLGLTPGVTLKVLNSGAPGPFTLSLRGFRVALGYGMAKKLQIRPKNLS